MTSSVESRSSWKHTTWGDEISLEYGKPIKEYKDVTAPYKVYGSNGAIGFTHTPLVQGPGVILGRKGAYRGVRYSHQPFSVIDTAYYVKLKSPDLDMRWVYYSIIHNKLGEIDDGSPIPSTTRAAVYAHEMKVPPLNEQLEIASTLGALDDKIEANQWMNETLEAMAQATFRDWFVDFGPTRAKMEGREPYLVPDIWSLFPDKLDNEGKPLGWKIGNIGECFDLTMGQSPPGDTYNENGEGLPFFQGKKDFGFRYPENQKYCSAPTRVAKADDTLMSVRAPVGDLNLAWEDCCIGRGVASLRHSSGSRSFTYYLMLSVQQELKQYEHTGTVFGSISKKQLEAIQAIGPTPELVSAFENEIGPYDELIRGNAYESATLTHIRDTLLLNLFSGKVRLDMEVTS